MGHTGAWRLTRSYTQFVFMWERDRYRSPSYKYPACDDRSRLPNLSASVLYPRAYAPRYELAARLYA